VISGSLVARIAGAFGAFAERYRRFFATRARDNSAVAERYLRGLTQATECTFEGMATVVEAACPQQFQHFISNSPWSHEPVLAQLSRDADRLAGGKPESCVIIDETSFIKQGERSVGVARQWSGRLGKVDNCQVAVFAVLSDGRQNVPIDMRLYLPHQWVEDAARCERAGVPLSARQLKSKSEHALELARTARARGVRFQWVGVDAGYGKEPAFLRALDDEQLVFVADVPRTQAVWTQRPEIAVPPRRRGQGRPATKPQAAPSAVMVEHLARSFRAEDWARLMLRDSTRGPLRVDIACRRIWVWDGEEAEPRCWHLIVRREVGSPKTIKYTLSNAPADTPVLRLAQMQGQRYWVERVFEDAKGECGLADYQALGWRAWHHHVTMVLLAMLFIAEQRAAHNDEIDLLTSRDIVEILAEILPRKPEGHEALVRRINQRHERRRGAIRSRYRDHHGYIAT
jgi:SRSO17 transposase